MWGFAKPAMLRRHGILGMNGRNVNYIARFNPRKLYPNVDNKYLTKKLCAQHGISVPLLLGVCRKQGQIGELQAFLAPHKQFVIKPAKGSGGKGILVITARQGDSYQKSSGQLISHAELCRHVSNVLSGLFSLSGTPDIAMIEDLVEFTDDFEGFSYQGVPDVRVIVYRGYPVMAMTRLSTRESDGKANLHQGAVGVGIDIVSGTARHAVQHNRPVSHHPDTGKQLSQLVVPFWRQLLLLASRGYEVSEMGYLGVDIVLDRNLGPLLLELNARPGLAIQMANGLGLKPRFKAIDRHIGQLQSAGEAMDAEQRVETILNLFAEDASH